MGKLAVGTRVPFVKSKMEEGVEVRICFTGLEK
jgi:hypothetical protein